MLNHIPYTGMVLSTDSIFFLINSICVCVYKYGFPSGSAVKNLPPMQETQVWSLDGEDPLQKGRATYSSILARKIPWIEEPGRLQSTGSQRVSQDWGDWAHIYVCVCVYLYIYTYHIAVMVKQMTSKGQKVIAYWLSAKGAKMGEPFTFHLALVSKKCMFLSSSLFKLHYR